jgi:hypothetical protein
VIELIDGIVDRGAKTLGGGTIDTNGNNVTLASSLSGTGGLTKTGAGTLARRPAIQSSSWRAKSRARVTERSLELQQRAVTRQEQFGHLYRRILIVGGGMVAILLMLLLYILARWSRPLFGI